MVPAKPVLPNNLMCIVELTNGFFRVLHINSGVTLTDTKGVAAAVKYISQVTHRLARDKPLSELFSAIGELVQAGAPDREIYARLFSFVTTLTLLSLSV